MSKSGKIKPNPGAEPEQVVALRVVCKAPPDPDRHGAEFGLQDSSTTANWVLHPGKRNANGDIVFECGVRVRRNARTGEPNFLGDFVHGSADKRFLYLSWRAKECGLGKPKSPSSCWQRRMKIHLSTINWELIQHANQSGGVLEAAVDGTGKDGGPNCASVALLGSGWTAKKTG